MTNHAPPAAGKAQDAVPYLTEARRQAITAARRLEGLQHEAQHATLLAVTAIDDALTAITEDEIR